jgi:hypothetical protein
VQAPFFSQNYPQTTIIVSLFALQIIYGFVQAAGERDSIMFGDFYVRVVPFAPVRVGEI